METQMPSDSTVLVVDDDPQVLEVAATACEEIGLNVLRAEDGEGALEVLRENPEVELLLTDISMPNMTGWELAHVAKQKYPDLKVIYVSGFLKTLPFGQHGIGYGPLLPKPWRANQLHEHIRAVLGR
jgi:CheY-like chemotaxis protein